MKIGNILAGIGIATGAFGLMMLPLYNFHELPFIASSGYAIGGGWKLIAQSGVFKWHGLYLTIGGFTLFFCAKILPNKYWETNNRKSNSEIKFINKKKKKNIHLNQ